MTNTFSSQKLHWQGGEQGGATQTAKLGFPLRWDRDLSLVRSQRVCPAKKSYICPTVSAQTQAFNQPVQSSQDETEEKLCLLNPSSCVNMYLCLMCTSTQPSVHSKTTQNLSAVVGEETPEMVSIWRTLIWKGLRCLFPATGFPMNDQGRASQMGRIKFTGRGCGKVSQNGISWWGSISIVKWIFFWKQFGVKKPTTGMTTL